MPGGPPPGAPGSAGAGGTFDGGYAQVIRTTDHPPRGRARPNSADPALPPDAGVFVYRDETDSPGDRGARPAARPPSEDDPSYWYDLLAEDPTPKREETRGPFEPLLSSGETPGAGHRNTDTTGTTGRTGMPGATGMPRRQDQAGPAGTVQPPAAARGDGLEAPDQARARKLEQLKDLYLTAEAIGEQNVDKHFDQLLAQQRELISDYFRQPAASKREGRHAAEATEPPEGTPVRADAEPPRAW